MVLLAPQTRVMAINAPLKDTIAAWAGGDEQAFRSVFDYFYPRLLAASGRIIKNKEDAEELVMNVLLKTWQHRVRIASIEQFESYIFGILRQQIAGFMRKKVLVAQPIDEIPLMNLGIAPEPDMALKEIRERYRQAIDKLSEQQRKIFLMSREDQQSHQQIADSTGLSINTVNNHIKAALKIIRNEFQEDAGYIDFLLIVTPSLFLL